MTGNGNGENGNGAKIGTSKVKQGLAQMLKGGVIVSLPKPFVRQKVTGDACGTAVRVTDIRLITQAVMWSAAVPHLQHVFLFLLLVLSLRFFRWM